MTLAYCDCDVFKPACFKSSLIPVAADCYKEGIQCSQDTISTAVHRVMQFFTCAKNVGKENSKVKSTSRIVKASMKRQSGSGGGVLWAALGEFETARQYDTCVIVSCSENNAAHFVEAFELSELSEQEKMKILLSCV